MFALELLPNYLPSILTAEGVISNPSKGHKMVKTVHSFDIVLLFSNDMTEQKSRQELRGEANVGSGKLEGRYYLLDQEHDCLESIFCCFCEAANEFAISETDPNFNVASKKGYIKETSDCLSRAFCVCNRPF
jgi:hypothetical protein